MIIENTVPVPPPCPSLTGLADDEDLAGEAAATLDRGLEEGLEQLQQVGRVLGCLSVRLRVDGRTGAVVKVESVADTLVVDPNDFQGQIGETEEGEPEYEDARADVLMVLNGALSNMQFPIPRSCQDTTVTVPFVFE